MTQLTYRRYTKRQLEARLDHLQRILTILYDKPAKHWASDFAATTDEIDRLSMLLSLRRERAHDDVVDLHLWTYGEDTLDVFRLEKTAVGMS